MIWCKLEQKLRAKTSSPHAATVALRREYLKCLDATKGTRLADYSSKHAASIGCNLLKLPHVGAAVKVAMGRPRDADGDRAGPRNQGDRTCRLVRIASIIAIVG